MFKFIILLTIPLTIIFYSCGVGYMERAANSTSATIGSGIDTGGSATEIGYNLRNGLVGYWPLDEDALDYSDGALHNGTWEGGGSVQYSQGAVGNAANFVATNSQAISFGNLGSIQVGTISFWLKPSNVRTAGDNWPNPFSAEPNGDDQIRGDYEFNSQKYCLSALGMCASYEGNLNVYYNVWTNIVLAYNYPVGISNEYHNGILVRTADISCEQWGQTFNYNFPDVYIGLGYGGSRYWDGMIDEVIIWNRYLSEDEISYLYNNGSGRTLKE